VRQSQIAGQECPAYQVNDNAGQSLPFSRVIMLNLRNFSYSVAGQECPAYDYFLFGKFVGRTFLCGKAARSPGKNARPTEKILFGKVVGRTFLCGKAARSPGKNARSTKKSYSGNL
jgi:hypothetical protein